MIYTDLSLALSCHGIASYCLHFVGGGGWRHLCIQFLCTKTRYWLLDE